MRTTPEGAATSRSKEDQEVPGLSREQRQRFVDADAIELQSLFAEKPEAKRSIQEMFEKAKRVNEGKQAVIFQLDVRKLTADQRAELEELGISVDDDRAIKILKLGTVGALRKEFDVHLQAHKVLGSTDEDSESEKARVPRPVLIGGIELPEQVRDQMKRNRSIEEDDLVEVMMMDFVPGKDLGTLLYNEAAKRIRPDIPEEDIERMDVKQLEEIVLPRIDARRPGGKGGSLGEKMHEQRKLQSENFDKLINWLSARGFTLDKRILTQLENGLSSLHSAGVYHRDLHLRNIMVVGEANSLAESDEVPQAFIIDFGLSVGPDDSPASKSDIYKEGDY